MFRPWPGTTREGEPSLLRLLNRSSQRDGGSFVLDHLRDKLLPVRAPESRCRRSRLGLGRRRRRILDSACLAGHTEIRIVHGHGTGRLRSAVREFVDAHVQVVEHRPGRPSEGGDGATVAVLR